MNISNEMLQEAAHKVVLLYKLTHYFNFYWARIRPIALDYWSISLAKEYFAAKVEWAPLKQIGCDEKTHRFLTRNSNIQALYVRSSAFPNYRSNIGLVSFYPHIDHKEELFGKAALFDILTSFSFGFGWKNQKYGTKEGEPEELLTTFDLQYSSADAALEDGMVELIRLLDVLHKTNETIN